MRLLYPDTREIEAEIKHFKNSIYIVLLFSGLSEKSYSDIRGL